MSKKDFESMLGQMKSDINAWQNKLNKLHQKALTEMVDDNYKEAIEKSLKQELKKYQCFLYVKRILDKPVRKKKHMVYERQCKLPAKYPEE